MSSNFLNLFIAKRRWLNKRFRNFLNDTAWIELKNGFKFYLDPKDLYGPSFHVVYSSNEGFENYEQIDKEEIIKALPKNGVFFDIGANIGIYTYYVKQNCPEVTIHCFEPHPTLNSCLNLTKNSNNLSKINIHNIGLSDVEGQFKLFLSEINSGGHSFKINANDKDQNNHILVQVKTLDKLCQEENIDHIDVIKIDVEGIEDKVLTGAIKTLKKYKPSLLIECDNKELSNEQGIISLFNKNSIEIMFKRSGEDNFLNIKELKRVASLQLSQNKELDSYFFKIL
jgi:FkbM family methyltransferase